MRKLEIIPIREFERFDDEMLSLITAGTSIEPSCDPNECGVNKGTCSINQCKTNNSGCTTNICTSNSIICISNNCGFNNPQP